MNSEKEGARTRPFSQSLIPAVQQLLSSRIRIDVTGASLTTFGIGGVLRALVTVESVTELQSILRLLHQEGQSVRVLGNGSNLLIDSAGVQAWVIKLGAGFRGVERISEETFSVYGAAPLMALARKLSEQGLSGLEFAAGIPASFGGALFMNAGAHGDDIGRLLVSVQGVTHDGSLVSWQREELPFDYRHSGIPADVVITSGVIRLIPGEREEISKRCAENLRERRLRQPLALPSAGSVFKNPTPSVPAGLALERAGVKGRWCGGVQVSELHANWIVNPEKKGSFGDVLALIQVCQEAAKAHAGVVLEPEVRVWRE